MQTRKQQVDSRKYSLILASASPRRKELLSWLEIPFAIIPTEIEERSNFKRPSKVVVDLARQKGLATYQLLQKREDFSKSFFPVVVAADTIVVNGSKILGKPKNSKAAAAMLRQLSGKEHRVLTGVYIGIFDKDRQLYHEDFFCSTSKVTFLPLTEDILRRYLNSNDALDKAGAYGIQGPALTFISKVDGSYSNVVGFPLSDFILHLKRNLGYTRDRIGRWRELFG
ncbi:MAG: septum formation protein Maf [Oligoflexia bacterium]|nr:septum formation protein Maf [Oligoflexia bacterium]